MLPVLEPEDDAGVLCLPAVIQEAVIAYLLEAMGKDMHQVAPDEFRVVQSDQAFWISGFSASGGKGNLIRGDRKDTPVGDGDFVGIVPQIFHSIAKTLEGLLDKRAPILFVKAVPPLLEAGGLTQFSTGRGKGKGSAFVKGRKLSQIFALELVPQDFHGEKKFAGGSADLSIQGKPAAGDDTVHMHMVSQFLVPGMEDLDDTWFCTKVSLIRGQLQERLGTAPVEEAVEKVLIAVNEWVQLMGEGEDYMKIG